MCADPAGTGACAALARRRRTTPAVAFERTPDARAPGPPREMPQILRVVRSRVGRTERGLAPRQRSAARGACRGRPSPALLLPRAARGDPEARRDRAETRRGRSA